MTVCEFFDLILRPNILFTQAQERDTVGIILEVPRTLEMSLCGFFAADRSDC